MSATQAAWLANGLGRHERHKLRESLHCYLQQTLSDLLTKSWLTTALTPGVAVQPELTRNTANDLRVRGNKRLL